MKWKRRNAQLVNRRHASRLALRLGAGTRLRLRSDPKELDDVPDTGVATRPKFFFDFHQSGVKFSRRFGVEFLDIIRGLADHVVMHRPAQVDFVQAGAVVKKRPADEPDLFESRHAAIDCHQIAGVCTHKLVNLFDAGGLEAVTQRSENSETRLGDAQSGRLQLGRGKIQSLLIGALRGARQGMVCLG